MPRLTAKRFLSALLQVPFWLLALSVGIWHLAQNSERYAAHGFVTIGHIAAPWVLLALLLATVGALLTRLWPLSAALSIAALPLLITLGPAFLRAPVARAADVKQVRVLSFNIQGKNPATRHAAIAQMLKRENADVVVLQECYPEDFKLLKPLLTTLYPHYVKSVENGGSYEQVTFSRWPIEHLETEARRYHLLKARVQTPSGPLQLWNAHSFRLNLLPRELQAAQDSWRGYANSEKFALSEGQYAWLNREIEQFRSGSEPLVLAGDFNLPARSYEYQQLTQKFTEAHGAAGFGLGMTYPQPGAVNATSRLPIAITRVDHIFLENRLQPVTAHVVTDAAGSDHAPIVADFRFVE